MSNLKDQLNNLRSIKLFNFQNAMVNNLEPNNYPKPSSLSFEVNDGPNFRHYHQVGDFFVSMCRSTGFMRGYEFKKGTSEGFSGIPITLPVHGIGKVFKNKGVTNIKFRGSLWKSPAADEACERFFGVRSIPAYYCVRPLFKEYYVRLQEDVFWGFIERTGLLVEGDSLNQKYKEFIERKRNV